MSADGNTPGIGDNNPPPYDPEKIAAMKARVDKVADEGGRWLDLGEISTDDEAGRLNDFIGGTRKLYKEIEEARKADKQPHLDAGKAVDEAWKPLGAVLENLAGKLKKMIAQHMERVREEQERARREEAERLRKAHEEAERAAREAAERNDVSGETEAQQRAREAQKAAAEAERAKPTGAVKSGSGGGRTMSLREVTTVKTIDNRLAAIGHLLELGYGYEFEHLIERLANAELRKADGCKQLRGITTQTDRRAA